MRPSDAFPSLPEELKKSLLDEYQTVVAKFRERRWVEALVFGGRFSEVVYKILRGYPSNYAPIPNPPENMVDDCRRLSELLDGRTTPRSVRILIPRVLPVVYEFRNNRDGSHVSGIVASHMDASCVMSCCNWVMGELVCVFHKSSTAEAQALVDQLTERTLLAVWEDKDMRRVLDKTLNLHDQILLLVGSGRATWEELFRWTQYYREEYLDTILKALESERMISFDKEAKVVALSPLGAEEASRVAARWLERRHT
jgi:hypothetical protein